MKRFAFVVALFTIMLPGVCLAGPFGFNYGMTKAQVIALVGKDAVMKDQGFLLRVDKAPNPDDAFEAYLLMISPDKGLLKIIATGKTIKTGATGMELQVGFKSLRDSIAAKYGEPTNVYDSVRPGGPLSAPSDWMKGLLVKSRMLAATWDLAGRKLAGAKDDHLTGIILEAKGLREDAGWVEATYEFKGFDEFYKTFINQKQEEQ